jgi:hypothetical protein
MKKLLITLILSLALASPCFAGDIVAEKILKEFRQLKVDLTAGTISKEKYDLEMEWIVRRARLFIYADNNGKTRTSTEGEEFILLPRLDTHKERMLFMRLAKNITTDPL